MLKNKYDLHKIYKFNIKGFSSFFDKNRRVEVPCLDLEIENEIVKVRSLPWQNQDLWKYGNINCEVIDYTFNGGLKLVPRDERHPLYEKGKVYKFECLKIAKKSIKSGQEILVIKMLDDNGYEHDVRALPNQENTLIKGDLIECRVMDITTKLILRQENYKDPYFYSFEQVISDKNVLKNDFFHPLSNSNEVDYRELAYQYQSKQAFWILTYCNKFLPKIFYHLIKEYNYTQALEVARLWLSLEYWIIESAILDAFNDDKIRLETESKVKQVISKLLIRIDILDNLTNDDNYLSTLETPDTLKLLEYISLCKFKKANEILFIEKIKNIYEIGEEQKYYFDKIANIIDNNKKTYMFNHLKKDYFIESTKLSHEQESKITKYLNWSYCQYLIYSRTEDVLQCNLIAAQIMRFFSQKVQDVQQKETFLYNAFYILSNKKKEHSLPISFAENSVQLNYDELNKNPNLELESNYWQDISLKKEKVHKVRVIEKYYKGYKVEIESIRGFLLNQNIYDRSLKRYPDENINWETNVLIHLYSKEFNFFVAKQLDIDNPDFYSKNLIGILETGEVIQATVTAIKDYGVFLNTSYGDGLLHNNNINEGYWDKYHLEKFFKVDEKIYIVNLGYEQDKKKYEFGFKQLNDTDYKGYYQNFISHPKYFHKDYEEEVEYLSNKEDINKVIEVEKGQILEQFAIIQENFENKINSIKISKHFFANINNARSYLHNIYIQYFTALNELDKLIENYSFDGYDLFRETIKSINIDEKTLQTFSEGEKLIFFVKVLSWFNIDNEEQNHVLMNYIQEHSRTNTSSAIFHILAKTTLANNLLLSEVQKAGNQQEALEFSLKNLKRIRDYIKNGVFSLAENKEDKIERQNREKLKEWKDKINQDEGETMEFKSTFKTPVLDEKNKKKLELLQEKLANSSNEKEKSGITNRINEINGSKAVQRIIHSALKSIAAFANTNGGVLLLGVADNKSILGLEVDYESLTEKDRDGFGKFFDSKIKDYFGDSFSSTHLNKEFLKFPEGDVLIVEVKKSIEEVFLLKNEEGKPSEDVYVRNLSSTDKLKGKELAKFIRKKSSEGITHFMK